MTDLFKVIKLRHRCSYNSCLGGEKFPCKKKTTTKNSFIWLQGDVCLSLSRNTPKPESNLRPGIQGLTVRISLKIKYIFSSILALKNLQKPLKHPPIFSSGTACQWLTTNISVQNKQQEILLSYSSYWSPPSHMCCLPLYIPQLPIPI